VNPKIVAWCFPLVVLSILVSIRFLDARIARGAMALLNSGKMLQISTTDIPDILYLSVSIGSCLLLGNYLILSYKGINNENKRFSLLAGFAISLAFFLKWVFKLVFGRTNTRAWLANRMSDDFHWFHGGGEYGGFPSGHMTVFSAFFAAIWLFYPRYRSISLGLTLILALALIITNYHFLSDVIAGAYLGLLATCITRACIDKIRTA
jgi:membrane-associated phospholipid phosphatase